MKRVCLLAVATVLAVPASALADATVSPGQKIQPAVEAAAAGDTITVLAGNYAEDVSVPSGKDDLKLAFQPGAALSGSLTVNSDAVQVSGLVLFRAAGTGSAVTGAANGLTLTDATVFATSGDAVAVDGADNLIQRSTLLTTDAAEGADGIAQGPGGLRVDSSIVVGGAKGVGLRVTTAQGSGAATATLNHVSITGAGGIRLEAPDATIVTQKVGDITLAVNGSIVHGTSTATESDGQPGLLPMAPPLVAPSVVKATYTNSDATAMTKAADSPGDPEISGSGNPTADDALFKAGSALRLKVTAPVIDKGGPVGTESDRDIDGEPRTNGAATDIGADEYTNLAPVLSFAITPDQPKTGQIVTAIGTATDRNGTDDVLGYAVDWGDGSKVDTTPSSAIQHVYEKTGTYTVTMLVADRSFATSAVVTKQITVTDGAPPQLQVTTPAAGTTVKLSRKKKKGAKRKPKPKAFTIKGVDADESGLASIELAITKTGSKCKQHNGRKLVRAGCTKYRFLKAKLKGNGFSLKVKGLAKGSYEIRARGTDTIGNASSTFDAATKTLVTFKVK